MREQQKPAAHDEAAQVIEQQRLAALDMQSIHYITGENAVFSATEGGFVRMKFREKECERIAVHRCFPFTDPDRFLSIRDQDGNELGIIRALSDLPEETQELLRRQMALRYFLPKILKVHSVKEEYGYSYWDVITDKGACRFTASSHNAVAKLSETRLIIQDIHGNRYEIEDVYKLTPKEIKKIDLYI